MQRTPRANRLHIGIYGKRNAGKSTLINELTGQKVALVSEMPGTTTDPVYKSMELIGVGPVTFIDTAGYDDEGELGRLRVKKTKETFDKADLAILVISRNGELCEEDSELKSGLEARGIKVLLYCAGGEVRDETGSEDTGIDCLSTIEELLVEIRAFAETEYNERLIVGDLISAAGLALLVMPQDIQAPKGRLILPQVQTIRELLDRKCTVVSATADTAEDALGSLAKLPDIVITDSQCFKDVYELLRRKYGQGAPALTSFSVLFAAYKGDIAKFTAGANCLDELVRKATEEKAVRILIAEACTHVPQHEDIGRVKIPKALKKYFEKAGAEPPEIVNVCGSEGDEIPLADFDLVIHCGACMFNRRHVLSRISRAEAAGIPITNYGIILAKLSGILDKVSLPTH